MTEAAFKDCEWYFRAAHADMGHRGQNIEASGFGGAPDSGPALERLSHPRTLRAAREVRRIEAVLLRLPGDVQRDIRSAFEEEGVQAVWIATRLAFTRRGVQLLRIAERLPQAQDACRLAHKSEAWIVFARWQLRAWFESQLKSHYSHATQELRRDHALSKLADAAEHRFRFCLDAYDALRAPFDAARAAELAWAEPLPGEVA